MRRVATVRAAFPRTFEVALPPRVGKRRPNFVWRECGGESASTSTRSPTKAGTAEGTVSSLLTCLHRATSRLAARQRSDVSHRVPSSRGDLQDRGQSATGRLLHPY